MVDTSALFPLLVYHYAMATSAERGRRQRLLMDARSKPPELAVGQYERWLKLFLSVDARLTTQHVIAELYSLRRRLRLLGTEDQEFWRCCTEFMIEQGVEQRPITLAEIWKSPGLAETSVRVGPVDAGLILLARSEGCTGASAQGLLVTEDGGLYREAVRLGTRCELLPDLLR